MSALGSVIGQPMANDLWRAVAGPANMVSGGAGWLSSLAFGGDPQPSRTQVTSGLLQSTQAAVGFTTRMLSAVGSVTTNLADRVTAALDTVAEVAAERGGSVTGNVLGMAGGAAKTAGGAVAFTVGAVLDQKSITRWGAETGASGLSDMASSGAGMAVRATGGAVSLASGALKLASGLVDLTGYPVKVYDLATGNVPIGSTPQKRTEATAALDAFRLRQDVPPETRSVVAQLAALNMADPDFHTKILSGAHVVVQDNGARYDSWNNTGQLGVCPRSSSHYGSADARNAGQPQRGFDLPGLGHVLFGTCRIADHSPVCGTWFQFEAHGMSARECVPHIADYVLHVSSDRAQVGPLGYALETEKVNALGARTHLVVANPPALP
jgi:hypothetical protein